jgi:glucose/arabinose dehydrogenase
MWWEESLPLFRGLGDGASVALISCSLGGIALERREMERAIDLLLEGLAMGEQIGYTIIPICFLETLADLAMIEEDPRSAARFLAAAGAAREVSGEVIEAPVMEGVQKVAESGRARIGEAEWDRAFQEGRTLPLEAAVAMARTYAADRRPGGHGTGTEHGRPGPTMHPVHERPITPGMKRH